MEALLYLVGLSSYLNPEIEKSRHSLVNELRHKLHTSKKVDCPDKDVLSFKECGPNSAVQSDIKNIAALVCLAESKSTPPYVLSQLAQHDNHEVRMAVADNPNAPFSVHQDLSEDSHVDVRYRLAENYHVRKGLLEQLALDDNPYVSSRAQTTLYRLNQA